MPLSEHESDEARNRGKARTALVFADARAIADAERLAGALMEPCDARNCEPHIGIICIPCRRLEAWKTIASIMEEK